MLNDRNRVARSWNADTDAMNSGYPVRRGVPNSPPQRRNSIARPAT